LLFTACRIKLIVGGRNQLSCVYQIQTQEEKALKKMSVRDDRLVCMFCSAGGDYSPPAFFCLFLLLISTLMLGKYVFSLLLRCEQ
jgi:hypothetical protein